MINQQRRLLFLRVVGSQPGHPPSEAFTIGAGADSKVSGCRSLGVPSNGNK